MNKIFRIATRASKLALWQAEHVASLIQPSGYQTEIVPIETRGDKILDVSIAKIGSKGVFTEEIEEKYSSIPWSLMRAMRNRIVHVYFRVDEKLMWDTIQNDLPPLVPELEKLL